MNKNNNIATDKQARTLTLTVDEIDVLSNLLDDLVATDIVPTECTNTWCALKRKLDRARKAKLQIYYVNIYVYDPVDFVFGACFERASLTTLVYTDRDEALSSVFEHADVWFSAPEHFAASVTFEQVEKEWLESSTELFERRLIIDETAYDSSYEGTKNSYTVIEVSFEPGVLDD